jgi:uncharacterized membrane protein YidH (DUF202 family)
MEKMRRKSLGRILLVVGVLCGIAYTIINLMGEAMTMTRGGNLLLYAGIGLIVVGLIVLGSARVTR